MNKTTAYPREQGEQPALTAICLEGLRHAICEERRLPRVAIILRQDDSTLDELHEQPDLAIFGLRQTTKASAISIALDELHRRWPALPGLVLAERPSLEDCAGLFAAGVYGYLEWSSANEEILAAASLVARHLYTSCLPMAPLSYLNPRKQQTPIAIPRLSKEQIALLHELAAGGENKTIAQRFHICIEAVEYRVRQLLKLSKTDDRNQLVAWWRGQKQWARMRELFP